MMKGASGGTLQKGQKKEKRQQKDTKKLTKRAVKSAATQGENTEISTRKALKICKMPQTKYSKTLRKYKL